MSREPLRARVALVSDVPPGRATVVGVGGREIAVFNVEGRFHALENRCAHRGGPLGEGLVRDGTVTCPWHWWRYEIRTGRKVDDAVVRVPAYPVEVRDGAVWVSVPPEEAPRSIRDVLLEHARATRTGEEASP